MRNTPPGMGGTLTCTRKACLLRRYHPFVTLQPIFHLSPTIVQQTLPHQAAPQNMVLRDCPESPIMPLDASSVTPINRAQGEPAGTVVTVSGRPSHIGEERWLLGDGTGYVECKGDLGAGFDWRIVRARVLDQIRLQIIDSRGK